jgi:sulfatase modifying factor 1
MEFVAKGGSFLCHNSYCVRYRTSSRQSLKANMTSGNIGFRVAKA